MMALTIGSVADVWVVVGGHGVEWVEPATVTVLPGGVLVAGRTSARPPRRAWAIRTAPLAMADALALEDELAGLGPVLVTGALVDTGGVWCIASEIQRHLGTTLLRASMSFRLHEVRPGAVNVMAAALGPLDMTATGEYTAP